MPVTNNPITLENILVQEKTIDSARISLGEMNRSLLSYWKQILESTNPQFSLKVDSMDFTARSVNFTVQEEGVEKKYSIEKPSTNESKAPYLLQPHTKKTATSEPLLKHLETMLGLVPVKQDVKRKAYDLFTQVQAQEIKQKEEDALKAELRSKEKKKNEKKPRGLGPYLSSSLYTDVFSGKDLNTVSIGGYHDKKNKLYVVFSDKTPTTAQTQDESQPVKYGAWVWKEDGELRVKPTKASDKIPQNQIEDLAQVLDLNASLIRSNGNAYRLTKEAVTHSSNIDGEDHPDGRKGPRNLESHLENSLYTRLFTGKQVAPVVVKGYQKKDDRLYVTFQNNTPEIAGSPASEPKGAWIWDEQGEIRIKPKIIGDEIASTQIDALASALGLVASRVRKNGTMYRLEDETKVAAESEAHVPAKKTVPPLVLENAKLHPLYRKLSSIDGFVVQGKDADDKVCITTAEGNRYLIHSENNTVRLNSYGHFEKLDDTEFSKLERALKLIGKRGKGYSAACEFVPEKDASYPTILKSRNRQKEIFGSAIVATPVVAEPVRQMPVGASQINSPEKTYKTLAKKMPNVHFVNYDNTKDRAHLYAMYEERKYHFNFKRTSEGYQVLQILGSPGVPAAVLGYVDIALQGLAVRPTPENTSLWIDIGKVAAFRERLGRISVPRDGGLDATRTPESSALVSRFMEYARAHPTKKKA